MKYNVDDGKMTSAERCVTTSPQLSGKANQGALSHSNALLRRLDLLSEMGGTLLFGCCVSSFGAPRTLAAFSALAAASLPVALSLVDKAGAAFTAASLLVLQADSYLKPHSTGLLCRLHCWRRD